MWPDHCVQGSRGALFHDKCQPTESDIIVSKANVPDYDTYSGFGRSILLEDLRSKGVTKLYCVGLAQDYCVGYTALDGVKEGFQTFVISDATKAVAAGSEEEMHTKLANAGVTEITHDQIITH